MIGSLFGTKAVTVPNFITVATQVALQLPQVSQLAILSEVDGLATTLRQPSEQVTVSDETFRRARGLLAQIVAMPEAQPHIRGLRRFREAWGIDAVPKMEPKPKPKPPRKPVRLPRPFRPSWEGDGRYDQERSREFRQPYRRGTLYAAVDRHSIVNE